MDQSEEVVPSFWDEAHTSRLALQGKVRELNAYRGIEGERFFLSQMKFNAQGNITSYNPVEQQSLQGAQPYWLPVSGTAFEYYYAGPRLIGIRLTQAGSPPVDYHITYDASLRYTSLEFLNLQPLTHIWLQGVAQIVASDGSVLFRQLHDGISIRNQNNETLTQYTYKYDGRKLPQSCEQSISVRGASDFVEKRQITYSYHSNGAIHEQKYLISTSDNKTTNETCIYNSHGQIQTHRVVADAESTQKSYTYNSAGLLIAIHHTDMSGAELGKMDAMYDFDSARNWTRAEQRVKGFLDWDMREGTYILIRDIVY